MLNVHVYKYVQHYQPVPFNHVCSPFRSMCLECLCLDPALAASPECLEIGSWKFWNWKAALVLLYNNFP